MSEEKKDPIIAMDELIKKIKDSHKIERETDNVEIRPTCFAREVDRMLNDLEFEKIDPADTTKFLSNEVYYEEISPSIKWEKNDIATCSKLFIRTIVEMAYRRGKKDGINTTSSMAFDYHFKKSNLTPHINENVPTTETPIGMYHCPKCGTNFDTSVVLCSDPLQVRCPKCNNTFPIGVPISERFE